MPTNTYVALDKVTISTSTNTITFSSVPQGYTDLVIVAAGSTSSLQSLNMRFNGDTGSNYSTTRILGSGSAASSARESNVTRCVAGFIENGQTTSIAQIMNYSNTTTFKTSLARLNSPASFTGAYVNLWRNTTAITSVTLFTDSGTNFDTGSTFSLYGIAATSVGAKATGGDIYTDSQYYYHVFDSTGTFTPLQSLSCDALIVAGGGSGGGTDVGGGGGAGGYRILTSQSVTATNYTVTVGAGGASVGTSASLGNSGTDSTFNSNTSSGGGGGGRRGGGNFGGVAGGSGGGGGGVFSGYTTAGGAGNTPSTSPSQGNNGGNGFPDNGGLAAGGGGGGAGAAASNATSALGSAGGVGSSASSTWGIATGIGQLSSGTYYLAGGGGGAAGTTAASGGLGGGGAAGSNGTANTGGGGGGSASGWGFGGSGSGGSGVVIIRYTKA